MFDQDDDTQVSQQPAGSSGWVVFGIVAAIAILIVASNLTGYGPLSVWDAPVEVEDQ